MYKEAAPFIEPDMSNYCRLQAEKIRRDRLKRDISNLDNGYEMVLQHPFALAAANAAHGNAKAEIRVYLRRLFEAILSGDAYTEAGAKSAKQIVREMGDFAKNEGLEKGTIKDAITAVTNTLGSFTPIK